MTMGRDHLRIRMRSVTNITWKRLRKFREGSDEVRWMDEWEFSTVLVDGVFLFFSGLCF